MSSTTQSIKIWDGRIIYFNVFKKFLNFIYLFQINIL
jgi:hypothetical protein